MNADSLFEELAEILGKEAEAHERLLAVARQLNQAAKSGDMAGVKRCTAAIDEASSRVERLEEKRKTSCTALVSATGLHGGQVRLSNLIAKAPVLVRSRLSGLRTTLKGLTVAIVSTNGANRLLCEEGARIARERLALILRPPARFANYREGGARCPSGVPSISLINRTA